MVQAIDGAHATQAAIVDFIVGFVGAVNRGDMPVAIGCFTVDATIVEDIAPFCWQGADAPANWLQAMGENARRLGVTGIAMEVGTPIRVEGEEGHGYAIFPGRLSLSGEVLRLGADGQLTFALEASGGAWSIAAMAWSGLAPA